MATTTKKAATRPAEKIETKPTLRRVWVPKDAILFTVDENDVESSLPGLSSFLQLKGYEINRIPQVVKDSEPAGPDEILGMFYDGLQNFVPEIQNQLLETLLTKVRADRNQEMENALKERTEAEKKLETADRNGGIFTALITGSILNRDKGQSSLKYQ